MSATSLQQRIQLRLDVLGKSPRAASLEAGMSADAIRSLFRNPDNSPTIETLRKLAPALQTSVEWLAFGGGEMTGPMAAIARAVASNQPGSPDELLRLGSPDAFAMARIDGAVQAGAYLEVELFADDQEAEYVSAPRDPDFPYARQVAYRVNGDSMNKADRPIRDGDVVICAMFEDVGLELSDLDGEIVVVQQTIADGQLRERSLKELRDFPDRVEYHPRTDNPIHKTIVVPKDPDPTETRQVEVIALHRFTFEGRPRPMRKRPR